MPNKRGPISKAEEDFMRENASRMSPAEIALAIERTEEAVRNHMITKLRMSPDGDDTPQTYVERMAAERELMSSPEWKALKDEFQESELLYFKHRFGKLMAQFRDDVLATEETQIFLLIKYEIMLQRNLKDTKHSVEDIERMETMLSDTYKQYESVADMDDQTKAFVNNLENQLASARVAKGAKGREYAVLQKEHSNILKELKATRDQRITRNENSKQTFLDLLKSLQDEEQREREGRHLELVRLAAEREGQRMAELHTYADGTIDQPLLTPETVR